MSRRDDLEAQMETCNFCNTLIKPHKFESHLNSYCRICSSKSGEPRFKTPIPKQTAEKAKLPSDIRRPINFYMKGVFEAFVAEVIQAPSFFGFKNFDRLYDDVNFFDAYLTEKEYTSLLKYIYDFETRWSKYIDMVLNNTQYMEISSTSNEPKDINTPEDWAAAIRNLLRILTLANSSIKGQLDLFLSERSQSEKKIACKKQLATQCKRPCKVLTNKLGKKYCTLKKFTGK
jgi:hypothetical protein